jgi:nucleotide-binding universal stress UspA family protein
MTKAKRRIVWSIDPFEERSEGRSHVIETLHELSKQGAMIDPVYVLSPEEYDVNVAFNAPWLKQIRPSVEKVLNHYLKDNQIGNIGRPQILIERRPSLRRAVGTLINYAEKSKADMIVVGTHAKKGISRFFLGSFAETLLLHSKIPVLVVGPHSEFPLHERKTQNILFSTDFGTASFPTFKKVLALAKAHHAKVTLFHCLPHPIEPVIQSGVYLLGGGFVSFPEYVLQDEERKQKMCEKYVAAGKKVGVAVDVNINPGHGNTANAIIEQAQLGKTDLIAMAAESGAFSAALIGSVTRQVVRAAPCPVWVLRAP